MSGARVQLAEGPEAPEAVAEPLAGAPLRAESDAEPAADDATRAADDAGSAAADSTRAADDAESAADEVEPGTGDSEPVPELDAETRARRDAALRQIRQFGDPVLRTKALAVERFDKGLREQVKRMGELMKDALGVGLAATQVGILNRVFVYRTEPEGEVKVIVNPEIERVSDERESAQEGCLSIAGVNVAVERAAQVLLRAQDLSGERITVDASGLEARVIQHELDHLDGVLILDRISREERREAMRAMRESREAGAGRADGGR